MLQLHIKTNNPDINRITNLIKAAIDGEIQKIQNAIKKTEKNLAQYESKYGISSEEFSQNGVAEDLEGGDDEYISWLGEYQIKQKLIDSLNNLNIIEYVTQ
jgi:predicted DNA-binding protein YlxM (UPF0122 family)